VPPAFATWEAFADALRWGAAAGTVPEPRRWWWELRPHATYGTLEVRVPDTQASVGDAAAIASVAAGLVGWLAARADAGDLGPPVPSWRIAENRWSACRDGVEGTLADLETGERAPTRERLRALLDAVAPYCAAEGLARAHELVACNGAMRQRAAGGPRAATAWLTQAYLG
jgi:carboxylate-amine ligase